MTDYRTWGVVKCLNPLPDKYVFIHYFQGLGIVQFLCLETFGAKFYFHFGTPVVLPNNFGQGGLPEFSSPM